jgi:hypothetical protein
MTSYETNANQVKPRQGSLQKAIDSLGAVEVAPRRYATRASGRWIVTSAEYLQEAAESGIGPIGASMPEWWKPEQRFAAKTPKVTYRFASLDQARELCTLKNPKFITVDLETGEEVPA